MISLLGSQVLALLLGLYETLRLFWESLRALAEQIVTFQFRWRETINQCFQIGVQSLPIIAFSLTVVGLMLVLEFSFHMKLVIRQNTLVPAFSTLLMLREMGPVVTCLLLTSRVGASIAAEIGTMRATDQIDALRMLSIDPVEYLTIPRWVACVLAGVCLSMISVGVALVAGALIASFTLSSPLGQFFNTMFVFARYKDVTCCLIKGAVFGSIIPIVASYQGFHCRKGAQGVGRAATAAVVHGSMAIIIADFILTYLLYAL